MTKFKMGDEVVHADYGYGIIINIPGQINNLLGEQVYGVMFGSLTFMIEESELEFKQHSLWHDEEFDDEPDDDELTPQKIKVVTDEDLETIFIQINKKITIACTVFCNQLTVGIASKSPNDEWDEEQGKALAYFRAHKE